VVEWAAVLSLGVLRSPPEAVGAACAALHRHDATYANLSEGWTESLEDQVWRSRLSHIFVDDAAGIQPISQKSRTPTVPWPLGQGALKV